MGYAVASRTSNFENLKVLALALALGVIRSLLI